MAQKTKKIRRTIVENGIDRVVEVEVPDLGPAEWPKPEERKVLGGRYTRLEAADKVTGRAKYTYDVNLPGLCYGKILRSPHAQARVVSIDAEAAKAMPGVKAVLTDLVGGNDPRVLYHGDSVAAVAAESEELAEDAVRAIKVQYEPVPFAATEEEAMKPDAPKVLPRLESNVDRGGAQENPNVDQALQDAAAVIHDTYGCNVQEHVCLETHGTVVEFTSDGVNCWASSQHCYGVHNDLQRVAGLPASKVRVVTEHMGGGFGSKFGLGRFGQICARLAREAKAPVKLMLTRDEEFMDQGNRPSAFAEVKLACDKEGKLTAMDIRSWGTGGVSGNSGFPLPYVYEVAQVRRQHSNVYTNAPSQAAMRAPGHPQGCFIMESALEDLAAKAGIDSLEIRKKNDPSQIRHQQYDIGARLIGWDRRNKTPGAGTGTLRRGIGVASGQWGGGGGDSTDVRVTIHPDGSVEATSGTQDLGTGTRTAIAVVVAEELGLTPRDIQVRIGRSEYGRAGGSGGSTTMASVMPVAKTAAQNAKALLFEKLSALGPAEDLQAREGRIVNAKDTSKSLTWKQAAAKLGMDSITAQGTFLDDLQSSGVAGCQFAEVEVDTETGKVRPVKVVAVHDCGLIVNRLATESQINGGIILGIGYGLSERRYIDPGTGRWVNPNLEDYKVPGSMEMPEIVVHLFDSPVNKVIGIGEPPAIPTAAAIGNAVFNAIGVRVKELPITPDKVLAALAARKEAQA